MGHFLRVVVLLTALTAGINAQTLPDGLRYERYGQSVTIVRYTGGAKAVVIPGMIDGLPVTVIGTYAFYGCRELTSITIPSSVRTIEKSAFAWCTGLKRLDLPNSVTSIGEEAFRECSGLTSITLPPSVTKIEYMMFAQCTGLEQVILSGPVTAIGNGAFYGCRELKGITFPASVRVVGRNAFSDCTGLTSVILPDSVTEIEYEAFSGCSGLKRVTISRRAEVGYGAFPHETEFVLRD
jgi:hypothetical protein